MAFALATIVGILLFFAGREIGQKSAHRKADAVARAEREQYPRGVPIVHRYPSLMASLQDTSLSPGQTNAIDSILREAIESDLPKPRS
jgi:hypothetical protein